MKTEWIVGKNSVLEALKADKRKIFSIHLAREKKDAHIHQIVQLARQAQIPVREVGAKEIAHQSGVVTHQGVACQASPFQFAELSEMVAACRREEEGSFILFLDEIQDPQNVGALIRTAHLLGAKGLVIFKHRSALITPTVVKVASGACEHLPIAQESSLASCLKTLKDIGFWVVGADGESKVKLYGFGCRWPMALVLGSEQKGLRRQVSEICDELVAIPMVGAVGSFNVSVAGALFMGEFFRQKLAAK